jgi:hypothetical protein
MDFFGLIVFASNRFAVDPAASNLERRIDNCEKVFRAAAIVSWFCYFDTAFQPPRKFLAGFDAYRPFVCPKTGKPLKRCFSQEAVCKTGGIVPAGG